MHYLKIYNPWKIDCFFYAGRRIHKNEPVKRKVIFIVLKKKPTIVYNREKDKY